MACAKCGNNEKAFLDHPCLCEFIVMPGVQGHQGHQSLIGHQGVQGHQGLIGYPKVQGSQGVETRETLFKGSAPMLPKDFGIIVKDISNTLSYKPEVIEYKEDYVGNIIGDVKQAIEKILLILKDSRGYNQYGLIWNEWAVYLSNHCSTETDRKIVSMLKRVLTLHIDLEINIHQDFSFDVESLKLFAEDNTKYLKIKLGKFGVEHSFYTNDFELFYKEIGGEHLQADEVIRIVNNKWASYWFLVKNFFGL